MDTFVKKSGSPRPSFPIGDSIGKSRTAGDVGIEIEVEGRNLLHEGDTPHPWFYAVDGSLRGEESAEYILNNPVPFDKVEECLNKLWGAFQKKKVQIADSNRTSVHVHLNCQKFHFDRLASFLGLYFAFEEILTEWCGDTRIGNLFCLRAKDAPAIITAFRKFIASDGNMPIHKRLRYAAINPHSLLKFGSLEIRTLRGTDDPQLILNWIRILQRFYNLSETFDDPRNVCEGFSGTGPLAFFDEILGEMAPVVRSGIKMNDNDIRESLYEGIRFSQDICYCRNWEDLKNQEVRRDPFGRSPKMVMKKIRARSVQNGPLPPTWEENIETLNATELDAAIESVTISENPFDESFGDDPGGMPS